VLDLSGKLKALEEQMHSILQHQAKVAADQAHALNQALDSRTQELLKAQASLTEVSQRHHTLQSQYDNLSSTYASLMSVSSQQGSAFAREISDLKSLLLSCDERASRDAAVIGRLKAEID